MTNIRRLPRGVPRRSRLLVLLVLVLGATVPTGCDPLYSLGVRNESGDQYFVQLVSADSIEKVFVVPPKAVGWIADRVGSPEHVTLLRADCSAVMSWDTGGVILISDAGESQLGGTESIDTAAKIQQVLGCGSDTPP